MYSSAAFSPLAWADCIKGVSAQVLVLLEGASGNLLDVSCFFLSAIDDDLQLTSGSVFSKDEY